MSSAVTKAKVRKRTRKKIGRDDAKRMLALDGDAFIGTQDWMERNATYIIDKDSMNNALLAWTVQAVHSEDDTPVMGVCDEYNSFLIFNKLYGTCVTIPVRNSDKTEDICLFSAFHPHKRTYRFDPTDFTYEPLYGGVTECGLDSKTGETIYAPRPAAICSRTTKLMDTGAGNDFGWRSLMYENSGEEDDKFPTGLVAIEGWLFKLVDVEREDEQTGKKVSTKEAVDENDLEEYAKRITSICEYAKTLTKTEQDSDGNEKKCQNEDEPMQT